MKIINGVPEYTGSIVSYTQYLLIWVEEKMDIVSFYLFFIFLLSKQQQQQQQ